MHLKKATEGGKGANTKVPSWTTRNNNIRAFYIYTLCSSKHNIICDANVFKVYSNFEYTSRKVFHSNNVCITAVGQ